MAMGAAYHRLREAGEGGGAKKRRGRRRLWLRLEPRRVAVGEGRVGKSELVGGDGNIRVMRTCSESWWREGSHGSDRRERAKREPT